MKHVRKSQPEPPQLADYRSRFALAPKPPSWNEFKKDPRRREPVKDSLRLDQRGLCAYCETRLVLGDESVEHVIAKSADHTRELDWSNLLLCCAGGERPFPEDLSDAAWRGEAGTRTCGHAKLASQLSILNPLEIPRFPRLFRFNSEDGAIQPDNDQCHSARIDAALAEQTISVLGLRAGRLNRARLAIFDELLDQLSAATASPAFSAAREREIATEQISAAGDLPAFFTAIRWFLGEAAETHLRAVDFRG